MKQLGVELVPVLHYLCGDEMPHFGEMIVVQPSMPQQHGVLLLIRTNAAAGNPPIESCHRKALFVKVVKGKIRD